MIKQISKKALICSIGVFENPNYCKLEGCVYDENAIKTAFIEGLEVEKESVFACGDCGRVNICDFTEKIRLLENTDIAIFYFSTHGGVYNGKFCLEFSDSSVSFNQIMEYINGCSAKNKIILVDSCFSGNIDLDDYIDINKYSNNLSSVDGYAVYASCAPCQRVESFSNKASLFTECLAYAMDDQLSKKSVQSLHNIVFLTNLYIARSIQNPTFKTNMQDCVFYNKVSTTRIRNGIENEYDLEIGKLLVLEKEIYQCYQTAMTLHDEYVSKIISLENFKDNCKESFRKISKIFAFDIQGFDCNKYNNYQEIISVLSADVYDYIYYCTNFVPKAVPSDEYMINEYSKKICIKINELKKEKALLRL